MSNSQTATVKPLVRCANNGENGQGGKRQRVAVCGFTLGVVDALNASGFEVCGHICTAKPSSQAGEIFASFETFKKFKAIAKDLRVSPPRHVDPDTMTLFMRCVDRWDWSREWVNDINSYRDLYALAEAQAIWWLTATKPDVLVFSNIPHQGALIALHAAAKRMKIDVIMTMQSPFGGQFWVMRDWKELGVFPLRPGEPCQITIDPPVAPPFYMKSVKGKFARVLRTVSRFVWDLLVYLFLALVPLVDRAGQKRKRLFNRIASEQENFDYFRRSSKFFSQDLDALTGRQYVYFPLHLQPEMTTDVLGGPYCDQVGAIEALRERLTDDVLIAVKENPKQRGFARSEAFFKRLSFVPGVVCLDGEVPSFKLIEASLAVATITGTAGWEALRMGKPAICFGDAFWNRLPGAFRIQDDWTFDALSGWTFDRDLLAGKASELSVALVDGYTDRLYASQEPSFDDQENNQTLAKGLQRAISLLHVVSYPGKVT